MDKNKREGQEMSKSDDVLKDTPVVSKAIDKYRKEMEERLYLFNSVEDLEKSHKIVSTKVSEGLQNRLPFKAPDFIIKCMESFKSETNKLFEDFKTQTLEKIESIHKKYLTALNVATDHYFKRMTDSLEANGFLSTEELNKIHNKFRVSALEVYESHFEDNKSYDPLLKNYESALKESIDKEFRGFVAKSEENRNSEERIVELASNLSIKDYENKVIQSKELYKQKMNEMIGDDKYMTDEELEEFNETIKDEIISELTKQSKSSFGLEVNQFIEDMKQFISVEYQTYLMKNLTNRNNINKQIKCVSQQSVNEYKRRIEEVFDSIQTAEELMDEHKRLLKEVLQSFNTSCGLNNKKYLEYQQTQIEGSISGLFQKYLDNFYEKKFQNKLIVEQKLKHLEEVIQQKYSQTMNSVIDLVSSEDDLNSKHFEVMEELLTEFKDDSGLKDMTLLEPYQKTLQMFMKNELIDFQKKLNEKFENINKSRNDSLSKTLITEYTQEMDNNILDEDFFYDQDFEELNSVYSNDIINKFEEHLKEITCSESQSYLMQLKQTLAEESNRLKEKFRIVKEMKLQKLDISLNKLEQMYLGEMKLKIKDIIKMEDLKECHQNVKENVIKIFKESHLKRFRQKSNIQPYIGSLIESFNKSLADFEDILEFKIDKIENLTEKLRLEIRRYYKEEMQKFFQNKEMQKFVQKYLLNICHKRLIINTIKKLSSEKGELSDKSFKELVEESTADLFAKIEEENHMKRPTESPAIGIDLGTTNSCIAFYNPDLKNKSQVVVIPNEFGNPTTPSVVSYRDNSIICTGDVAKDEIHAYPWNTISSVKRLIGRHFNDESVQNDMELWSYKVVDDGNNIPKVSVKVDGQDQVLYPEQISAQVLRKMKEIAETHFDFEVTKAVITVPAYFNDQQKQATKAAGLFAGLEVLRIINEPTAAAIAFKVDRNEETIIRKVLIFDFGGGTFDVSIIEINRGKITVRAVGGDIHLGGDDFDTNIVKYCLGEFYKECNIRVEGSDGMKAKCRLRIECEKHKKKLTAVQSTVISIDNFYKRNDLRVVLTRDKFEELNHHLFVRSIDLVKETLGSKGINPFDIDDVVLVGGSTRIPKIQEMLSKFFDGKSLNHWVNPDEAVAKGAAIHAAYLNGKKMDKSTQLEDVTPLSLGIEIKGEKLSVIIPRNTPVPTTKTEKYFTVEDNQTEGPIKIFEGEKKMAKNNHLLGQFNLQGIPPAPKGKEPIDVTFSINDEGILHVKAKIRSTGGEKNIEITEHGGRLTKEMIEQLLIKENPTFGDLFK